ncbi:MAG: hypothetical protein AAGF24_02365, partial [Cyanobacteria bacterium P01_H01_bin.121]
MVKPPSSSSQWRYLQARLSPLFNPWAWISLGLLSVSAVLAVQVITRPDSLLDSEELADTAVNDAANQRLSPELQG